MYSPAVLPRAETLPFSRPDVGEEEINAVRDSLREAA